ncbi:MAG TPA: hypothetical protein VNR65_16150 [Geobacterales bacterium]|nr:hypothetical protein [Geobacterales bacterium]
MRKTIGLTLVTMVALSAAAVAVANAVEGPFYKVGGSRLLENETRLLLASAKPGTPFVLTGTGLTVTCTSLSLPVANEMQLIGSTGANAGKSLEALHFTGCTVASNGAGCDVENGLILTNLVSNLLGYSTPTKTGPILVLFVPDQAKDFVTIHFKALSGGECKVPSALVEGSVIGLARVNGANVVVGSEPAETLHGEVSFAGLNKTIWMESNGTLMSVKSGFNVGGLGAKFTGIALLLVDSAAGPVNWGVFTA